MAEQTGGKSQGTILGVRPPLLVLLVLCLAAAAVYLLFPGLFGGGAVPAVQGQQGAAVVTTAAKPAPGQGAPVAAAPSGGEQDELSTFLVRFGRANPFAPLGAVARAQAGSKAPKPAAGSQPTLDELRGRLQNLATGQSAGSGSAAKPDAKSGQNAQAQPVQGFVLEGIVRLQGLTLAVIRRGNRSYYVREGAALEKTGYVLRSIGRDRVVLVAEGKELVLVLGGKKA
ncbi:MAG: hypothetical protein ACM3X6_01875 [Patescibacteria group bacterium]